MTMRRLGTTVGVMLLAGVMSTGCSYKQDIEKATTRAEDAARRAESAASRVEAAAKRAEMAATRAEQMVSHAVSQK